MTDKNRIISLLSEGRVSEAITALEESLQDTPDDAYTWYLLGAAFGMQGNYDRSVTCCEKAINLAPDFADAHYNLSQALLETGRLDDARSSLLRCLEYDGQNRAAVLGLSRLYNRTGGYTEAEKLSREFLVDHGADLEIIQSHLESLIAQFKDDMAESFLDSVVTSGINSPGIQAGYATLAFRRQHYSKAIECYAAASKMEPLNPDHLVNMALTYLVQARYAEADTFFRQALTVSPGSARARSGYLFSLNYYLEDKKALSDIHKKVMAECSAGVSDTELPVYVHRRIRIGYVSPDFKRHSVAYFIEAVLNRHDREKFDVYCYSLVTEPDDVTRRIKGYSDHWRDIAGLSGCQAREAIMRDEIDILVDLAGHTTHETMPIFFPRSARIQITYLGYPNITGLSSMDYRISDRWADPEDLSEGEGPEKILYLSGGFLCYRAPQEVLSTPVADRNSAVITFGSFNNFSKITPEAVGCWAEIMGRVAGSRLLIKNRSLGSTELRQQLFKRFSAAGITENRVTMLGHVKERKEHLSCYNDIDISLDTFPYNGTTTTFESLWMGVPVIGIEGETHASRVGLSILSQAGLAGYVARNMDEYVEIAVNLARDRGKLAGLRHSLRGRLATALGNETAFVQELEAVYQGIYR